MGVQSAAAPTSPRCQIPKVIFGGLSRPELFGGRVAAGINGEANGTSKVEKLYHEPVELTEV